MTFVNKLLTGTFVNCEVSINVMSAQEVGPTLQVTLLSTKAVIIN